MSDPAVRRRTARSTGAGHDRQMAGSRFSDYVHTAMAERDLSLAELARQSGIEETQWHGWFRGAHRPRRTTLARAQRTLRRTPEQMQAAFDGDKPPRQKVPADPTDIINGKLDRIIELLERGGGPATVAVIAEWARQLAPDGTLSPHPTDDDPDTSERSSPIPAAHPNRRRDDPA